MVLQNGTGDGLKQHRLTGTRRRDDETTLSFADRRGEIHDTGAIFFTIELKIESFFRIERGKVVEENLVPSNFRVFIVDLFDLEQREIALAFLRRPDLAGHDITGSKVESANLRGGDVDVIGTGTVVGVRSPEKPEPVRQGFQHTLAEHNAVFLRLRLQDREDQFRLSEISGPRGLEVAGGGIQ